MPAPIRIGVLAPLLGGYYFGQILHGICTCAWRHGLQVLGEETSDIEFAHVEKSGRLISTLPPARDLVSGWVMVSEAVPLEYLRRIRRDSHPLVLISVKLPELDCLTVMPNNYAGVIALVRHLITHGHRKIAFVGFLEHSDVIERFEAYQIALAEHGIPNDPHLCVSIQDNLVSGGQMAAQQLLAAGMPCTAVVAGTDSNAIGLIQELQARGYRIPEDIAVVGFDDIPLARYLEPPLTTVRQRFEVLGERAVEVLVRQIAGEAVPSDVVYVDTEPVLRYSCGCSTSPLVDLTGSALDAEVVPLAEQLSQLLSPTYRSHAPQPARILPEVEGLARMVDTLIHSGTLPSLYDTQRLWNAVLALAPTPEVLNQIHKLIRQVVITKSALPHDRLDMQSAVFTFLDCLDTELVRACMGVVLPKSNRFDQVAQANYHISNHMLNTKAEDVYDLSWLHWTSIKLGCLAVWDQPLKDGVRQLRVVSDYPPNICAAIIDMHVPPEAFPTQEFLAVAQHLAPNYVVALLPLRNRSDDWGILVLVGPIEIELERAEGMMSQWAALLSGALQRANLLHSLDRRTAELARADRLKDEFLASMSHELRTPLNTILGMSETLQEQVYGPLNERQSRSLHTIEESGRHLLALINDILDLSKIGAGQLELQFDLVDVNLTCQASLNLVREATQKKRLPISTLIDPDVTTIIADARRLKQILVNLLSNAVKFTPKGGRVGLEVVGDAAQSVVRLIVWDSGIGIAPEDQTRLFQPFVQLDSRLAREYEGTGLGLALVAHLAALHGGSVAVESTSGQGSRFTVSLPWAAAPSVEPSPSVASGPLPAEASLLPAHPTIVLAEDNEENITMTTDYLEAHGCRVEVARDGQAAISLVRALRPQVVLMDIQMPGMDGLAVMRHLRADTDLATIPIIALTALAMSGDRERCLEAGASDYLTKPVRLKELLAAIKRQLLRGGLDLTVPPN